jgi:hypothetical protein
MTKGPQPRFSLSNNLPPKVETGVFTVAERLIKVLNNDDASQLLRWDLRNESNSPIASEIYVCYKDMPEIGETKVVKLALVQPLK